MELESINRSDDNNLSDIDINEHMNKENIIKFRKQHLCRNYSTSYNSSPSGPLHIIKGKGIYLYDENNIKYLDCVNNVCHVGHCHPKVVNACKEQIEILNTNTRYLHSAIVEYVNKLLATLPSKLDTVFLVCTGSEANDLALRLARKHTNNYDIICVDHAYHGNLTSLIEISPYKYKGNGGFNKVPTTHVVSAPDTYRGQYNDKNTAGVLYGNQIYEQCLHNKIAAFICESVLGCAGQIPLPKNYLKTAYKHARNAGAVCIADEVQVGFGRVGTHFWGFETQDVIPDIVTMGKPIGNGFPLACVVCTSEIAQSFNNGMEYFNTFGGNPVACRVGLSVLQVIEEEELQKNALIVGAYLLNGLNKLKEMYDIIGDVRGLGLFVGIELVKSRHTKQPADRETSYIANMMRERHILISTDGPYHNVLKLKPPICFSKENADSVIRNLNEVLQSMINCKL